MPTVIVHEPPGRTAHAEREALHHLRACLEAAAAYVALAWQEDARADWLSDRLNDVVRLCAVPENAAGIARRYLDGLPSAAAQRNCPRCGDAIHGTGDLCRRCIQNRIALRVMRDAAWPDGDDTAVRS